MSTIFSRGFSTGQRQGRVRADAARFLGAPGPVSQRRFIYALIRPAAVPINAHVYGPPHPLSVLPSAAPGFTPGVGTI